MSILDIALNHFLAMSQYCLPVCCDDLNSEVVAIGSPMRKTFAFKTFCLMQLESACFGICFIV